MEPQNLPNSSHPDPSLLTTIPIIIPRKALPAEQGWVGTNPKIPAVPAGQGLSWESPRDSTGTWAGGAAIPAAIPAIPREFCPKPAQRGPQAPLGALTLPAPGSEAELKQPQRGFGVFTLQTGPKEQCLHH